MAPLNKSETKSARAAQRAMYAPKSRGAPAVRSVETAIDLQLRKLTGRVLEDLKLPSAIPSQVIAQALRDARSL